LYVESNRTRSEIQRDLAHLPELKTLSEDLYPELKGASPGAGTLLERAELHTVARMLATMENAWIGLAMQRTSTQLIHRGWMNAFRRWVGSEAFRRSWPILRSEYSADFVRFCEEQLHLVTATPAAIRLEGSYDGLDGADALRRGIDLIDAEFAREWPAEHRRQRGPKALLSRATRPGGAPLVWLIAQAPSGPEDAEQSPTPLACGIILAAESSLPVAVPGDGDGRGPLEFFVWVRRPYRAAGLGSRCVLQVLPELEVALRGRDGRTPDLWALYPEARPGDHDLEYSAFLRFLSRFDFRPSEVHGARQARCSLLRRPARDRMDGTVSVSPVGSEV
jgi:hypothetical protein